MKQLLLAIILCPALLFGQSLQTPTISHESGFYTSDFYLKITHPDPNVTILYTLDGSEPKMENLTGKVWNYKKAYSTNGEPLGPLLKDTIWTFVFSDSLLLKDRFSEKDKYADISASFYTNWWYNSVSMADSLNVFKGYPIRAVAYLDGLYSEISTKNIFISEFGANRYTLPITCLNIEPELFFGYENGLNVPGILFDEWRNENPTENVIPNLTPSNFRASGSSSEIKLHYSYIVNNEEVISHGAGLRLHGNGSRFFANRSYRLYAKSSYGSSSFSYPYFPNDSESNFKRIILRNSGNDCSETMFRDALIHQVSKNLNVDIQEYQPTILFINGEYFGIYNIRERFDDKYFEQKYGIDVDDLDHLENDGLVSEGDDIAYNELMDFLDNNSFGDSILFNELDKKVDIVNYTDYFITEIFSSNIDWPHNNNEYWRKKVVFNENASYGHDGRWRWLLKDLDHAFGYRWDRDNLFDDLNFVSNISENEMLNRTTLLFRKLLENENYKIYFINRFSDILNSTFIPSRVLRFSDSIKSLLQPEIEEFFKRWNPSGERLIMSSPVGSSSDWNRAVDDLDLFSIYRPYSVRRHIQNRFSTGGMYNLTLNVSDTSHGSIKINTLTINESTEGLGNAIPYPWTGTYFEKIPVTITAIPKEGYVFTHWSGNVNDTVSEIKINLESNFYIKANFVTEEEYLSTNYIFEEKGGIVIYPNPTKHELKVLGDIYEGFYTIYSIDGKLVDQGNFNNSSINIEKIPAGIYIFELSNKLGKERLTFIKE